MKSTRAKRSKIWKLTKEEIQNALDSLNSYTEILEKFNLNPYSGMRNTFMSRIKDEGYDLSKFEKNSNEYRKSICIGKFSKDNKKDLSSILTENSSYSRVHLKKRLVSENILENKCSECSIYDVWNNKPISLQLDHINGIRNDNRIKNLRLLCPNCHSQTHTFSGRNLPLINKCLECNCRIKKQNDRCKKCSSERNGIKSRKFEISKEELTTLIKQYPMTKVGEILGVSDNAIRKRCKRLEIDYKNL
jgi:Zn finger protein HypA/HybF involved in hydrogenase expression